MGCLHPKKEDPAIVVVRKHENYSQISAELLTADQWKEKGNEQFKEEEFALAVKYYSRAIVRFSQDLDPNASIYFSNRARGLLQLKQYKQAAEDAQAALNLDKYNIKAYLLFSQSKAYLAAKGQPDLIEEALRYCNQALAKSKERQWSDGVEKSKELRCKLRVLKFNAEHDRRSVEKGKVISYYTVQINADSVERAGDRSIDTDARVDTEGHP